MSEWHDYFEGTRLSPPLVVDIPLPVIYANYEECTASPRREMGIS